jgi:hypothetical protein
MRSSTARPHLTPAMIGCAGSGVRGRAGRRSHLVRRREDRQRRRAPRVRPTPRAYHTGVCAELGCGTKRVSICPIRARLPAITSKDRTDLDFVCQHADMVAALIAQLKTSASSGRCSSRSERRSRPSCSRSKRDAVSRPAGHAARGDEVATLRRDDRRGIWQSSVDSAHGRGSGRDLWSARQRTYR